MTKSDTFIGQPIRSLQNMLRIVAKRRAEPCSLVPDGIYGPETTREVTNFQQEHLLPVTGIVNEQTWDAITAAYETELIAASPAHPLCVTLDREVCEGDSSPDLLLAQSMLTHLSHTYGNICKPSLSGILDDSTRESLSVFQTLAQLPATGHLDKLTWKNLSLHYSLACLCSESNGVLSHNMP